MEILLKHPLVAVVPGKNDRYAVLARHDQTSPWTQVESIISAELAIQFAQDLIEDFANRDARVEESKDEDWGNDAPANWDDAR